MLFKLTKTLLTFIVLIYSGFAYAQKPLTPSRQSSYYTDIYKITDDDVLKFYQHSNKKPDEKILHTKLLESTLPPRNYIKVAARRPKPK